MRVILVEPKKTPRFVEIDGSLESMQNMVGGWIEQYMPFEDEDVAVICNEEGKMLGMPLNRCITNEHGNLMDIIAGTFFLAYAPLESEKFLPLPEDLEEKYFKRFETPEEFIEVNGNLTVIPIEPLA